MSTVDYKMSKLRKGLSFCLVIIVLLSLSNSFMFQFIDSSTIDSIEFVDESESEKETESEKDSEKESVEEFMNIYAIGYFTSIDLMNFFRSHCCNPSQEYIDILTPPPEFI